MYQIYLPSGKQFTANGGETLMAAAARAGHVFNYSCKTGRCSTCKCRVVSGTTRSLHLEDGLNDDEKAEGWILSCVRSAETDVVLEVDELSGMALPPTQMLPCRIDQIHRLAPDVIQVTLRIPPTADFIFIPGQYIEVIGPQGIRRSYSLSHACGKKKLLEVHIRAVEDGAMSQYWFNQAKINDLLRLNGPLGTFFLRETADIDLVFLATGTGIAPVKAMLESIQDFPDQQQPQSVTVLWGGRIPQDLYLDIAGLFGQYNFVPVLSRAGEGWNGAKGYVQEAFLGLKADLCNTVVYACGSDTMIHSARGRLEKAGLPPHRFYSDAFVCSGTN